jgi:hypothetical protein
MGKEKSYLLVNAACLAAPERSCGGLSDTRARRGASRIQEARKCSEAASPEAASFCDMFFAGDGLELAKPVGQRLDEPPTLLTA